MPMITVGITLSDANMPDRPNGLRIPEDFATYAREYMDVLETKDVYFELQPEDRFTKPARYPDQFQTRVSNRWMRAYRSNRDFRDFIDTEQPRLGVHMPTTGRDPLSSNFFGKHGALDETRRAMDLAAQFGAEYFVIHLATRDKWTWEREDQIKKGLKIFKELATYYSVKGYDFTPLIEVLPYPRFPAHGGETMNIYNRIQHILPETRIAFNISHLWLSARRMIVAGIWQEENFHFIDHLDYALSRLWHAIEVFQLGGCWESTTHAIPGLHPQQDPFEYPIKLRETPGVYEECGEIDLNRTLQLLLKYTVKRDRRLNLVLDIRDRDIARVLEAARVIRNDLIARCDE